MATASVQPEEPGDGGIAGFGSRSYLVDRAAVRLLVRPEAKEPRAVPEAGLLPLVVANLDDHLGTNSRLLEVARPPPVRLREAALGRLLEERHHALGDLRVPLGCHGGRADVFEGVLLVLQAE